MKFIRILSLILLLTACGEMEKMAIDPLPNAQPRVLSVSPPDGAQGYTDRQVEVTFSHPIDFQSVSQQSFFVTALTVGEVDPQAMLEAAEDEEVSFVEGDYEISEDQRIVRFRAYESFPDDTRFGLFVTPLLLSVARLPLNQTPGENPTPFYSTFATPKGEGGVDEMEADLPALPRPDTLVLNEIFYDIDGRDTEGDLFIELLGDPNRDLSGYIIYMVNGDDGRIVGTLVIPDRMQTDEEGFFVIADSRTGMEGITNVHHADWVKNLDPPNGPDCIQLADPEGYFVDAVGYGSPLVLRGDNDLFCYEGMPTLDVPSGASLSRLPDADDTDNNEQDWVLNYVPSPGSLEVQIEEN